MSRYDRYSSEALAALKKAKLISQMTGKSAMGAEELLRAVLEMPGNPIEKGAARRHMEIYVPPVTIVEYPSSKVELGSDLRAILDAVESSTRGEISLLYILQIGIEFIKPYLSPWLKHAPTAPDKKSALEFCFEDLIPPDYEKPPLEGILAELGRDLTAIDQAHPIVGRDPEIHELASILLKFFKPNAILLGDAGVGKTAVVEGLAQRIRAGTAPAGLAHKRIVEITTTAILGGTSMHGEYEKRMRKIVEQAEQDPDLILFIDEIHMLVGAGARSSIVVSAK